MIGWPVVFEIFSQSVLSAKLKVAGVSYSIWVAFGSIGSMFLGLFLVKEKMNWLQFISIYIQ